MDLTKFSISKPTLRDIPVMRNLILPEVQRGIILDRTEDEMASAIRSYSVVCLCNSSLDNHSADSKISPSLAEGDKGGGLNMQKISSTKFTNSDYTHPLAPSAREGGQKATNAPIIAFAALQILSPTLAEIRSLIVGESYRRLGIATALILHLIKEGESLNLKEILTLTYQKEVFAKIGFKEIAKDSLPNQKIWADCIKCKKFPICDEIALLKTL